VSGAHAGTAKAGATASIPSETNTAALTRRADDDEYIVESFLIRRALERSSEAHWIGSTGQAAMS